MSFVHRVCALAWSGWLALALQGCHAAPEPPPSQTPSTSPQKQLATSLLDLYPAPSASHGESQFHLSPVHMVQINLRRANGTMDYYRLYRQRKAWWVIHSRKGGGDWGHTMRGQPVRRILNALQKLKPATQLNLSPDQAQLQISFFTKDEQFLLRMLQAPHSTSPQSEFRGEWLLYHRGELYQQAPDGPLTQAVPTLRQALRQLRHRSGWLQMPVNSNSFSIPVAQRLAHQFHKKRLSLRRCFQKRRFPSHIGPLRMDLTFSAKGTLLKRKIRTHKHKKHKVVWCPWWHVKQWKFTPPPGKPVSFALVLPPHGP